MNKQQEEQLKELLSEIDWAEWARDEDEENQRFIDLVNQFLAEQAEAMRLVRRNEDLSELQKVVKFDTSIDKNGREKMIAFIEGMKT